MFKRLVVLAALLAAIPACASLQQVTATAKCTLNDPKQTKITYYTNTFDVTQANPSPT